MGLALSGRICFLGMFTELCNERNRQLQFNRLRKSLSLEVTFTFVVQPATGMLEHFTIQGRSLIKVKDEYATAAESLWEAVAQGLAALRRSDWVAGFRQGIVKVSVADFRVEHQVKLTDFTKWLERTNASSPREMVQRQRLRTILGMPAR